MKAFVFRGERLLEWRRTERDAARVEFVRASESARAAASLVADADRQIAEAGREYLEALRSPIGSAAIERYRIWIGRWHEHARTCRRAEEERRTDADAAAVRLQTANRNVRIMERLRERAAARHRDAERQLEMKTFDELATRQYARRGRQGADR